METQKEKKENSNLLIFPCPIEKHLEYFISASTINSKESYLSIYKFLTQSKENLIKIIKKIPITEKFTSISWTSFKNETEENSFGIVIGGHLDGKITLWNIKTILEDSNENPEENLGLIYNEKLLENTINVISVNNEKNNLFGVGTNKMSIISIDEKLTCSIILDCEIPNEKNEEFISIDWNPKVNYILASGTNKGMTYIFDMKKKNLFLSISEQSILNENNILNTNIIWYNDGAQIIISYEENEYNYMLQYHMKQPKIPCAMFQNGHNGSIIFFHKNNFDKNFLLTLGNDNFVVCWNLKTKKIVNKIQLKCNSNQIFWCGNIKDCFIYLGNDNNFYYDRINFTNNDLSENCNNIPNWMIPNCGSCFSFDDKLYKFSKEELNIITISKLKRNEKLNENIKNFSEKIEKNDSLISIIEEKINNNLKDQKHTNKSLFYSILKGKILEDENYIFKEMGLDKEKLINEIDKVLGKKKQKEKKHQSYIPIVEEDENENVELIFNEEPIQSKKPIIKNEKESEEEKIINENYQRNINWNVGNEKLIKNSLLLGEIESAVELLFKSERYSEALIIASLDNELFNKVKENYFKVNNDLFIQKFFPAIINKDINMLLDYNLSEWKEFLLYAKNSFQKNDFQNFSEKLGDKLYLFHKKDIYPSLICYVLANKFEKIINLLCDNYFKENERVHDKDELLINVYEDLMIIYKILNGNLNSNENLKKIIYDYCLLLIREGLNVEAAKNLNYLRKDNNKEIEELYNRLYYNCEEEIGKSFSKPKIISSNIIVINKKKKNIQKQEKKNILEKEVEDIFNNDDDNNENKNKNENNIFKNKEIKKQNPIHHPPKIIKRPIQNEENTEIQKEEIEKKNIIKNPSLKKEIKKEETEIKKTPFENQIMKPKVFNPNNFKNVNSNNNEEEEEEKEYEKNDEIFNFGNEIFSQRMTKPPLIKSQNKNMINQKKINNNSQNNFKNETLNQNNNNELENDNEDDNNNSKKGISPFQNINQNIKENIPMNNDEENIYNYFNNYSYIYSNVYHEESKRKDFNNKLIVLLNKLENHELKVNVLTLLQEFIKLNNNNNIPALKKLYLKIQSCEWDKNKSWMPLLERIINMKRH